MKKIILILGMGFFLSHAANAQNKKIYVSKQGGKPQLLFGFKMGYNSLFYTNNSDQCDTLICHGSGYERCMLDRNFIGENPSGETKYYEAFNSAIHKTEKHIKRTQTREGSLTLPLNGQRISVNYKNADKKGNADMVIEIL